jgi:hypothetical protein
MQNIKRESKEKLEEIENEYEKKKKFNSWARKKCEGNIPEGRTNKKRD